MGDAFFDFKVDVYFCFDSRRGFILIATAVAGIHFL
jgi:hypothetical protein